MFGTEGFDSTSDVLVRKDVSRCDVVKHFLVVYVFTPHQEPPQIPETVEI